MSPNPRITAVSFFSGWAGQHAAAGNLGRLRRGITPKINTISSIILVFSLVAIVSWNRLRVSAEGKQEVAA